MMALVKHESAKRDVKHLDLFDRFFDDWPEVLRRPVFFWPERGLDPMRVEEFTEDGMLVIRVEMAGLDPEKDVDVSVEGDVLHIGAERREEEKTEERDYVRREMHYGSFRRDLPLPKGMSQADVKATYKDGILEVRVPLPKAEVEAARKILVTTS
jgi:HSP20 family protein